MTTWRSRKGLALACGVLLASVVLSRSATTHAQTARLEIFVNWGDQLAYQGSSNGGLTWDPFRPHPNSEVLFRGAPAAVSDRAGHIVVAVREHGNIRVSEFFTNPDRWNGFPILASGGGRTINGTRWDWNSDPTITSWGSGRFDLFIHGRKPNTNNIALIHTWAVNNRWTGTWEVLGTGFMQGSPAAVSWGPGRIDVFARGGGGELVHKWFDGRWSGWESLGGFIQTDPGVSSARPGHLDVYAIGGDFGLWHIGFDFNNWWGWSLVPTSGCNGIRFAPSPTSRGIENMDVFVGGCDDNSLIQYSYNSGWAAPRLVRGGFNLATGAIYWAP